MSLKKQIKIKRVNILSESSEEYEIEYNGNVFSIIKGSESCFHNGTGLVSRQEMEMKLEQRIEQQTVQMTEIFQDVSAPKQFHEVMMFHELREMEYKNAGLKDAHKRAVNDEVLYALKYLNDEEREKYFKFSRKIREKAALELRKTKHIEREKRKNKEREEQEKEELKFHELFLDKRSFDYKTWEIGLVINSRVLYSIHDFFRSSAYKIGERVYNMFKEQGKRDIAAGIPSIDSRKLPNSLTEYIKKQLEHAKHIIYVDVNKDLLRAVQLQSLRTSVIDMYRLSGEETARRIVDTYDRVREELEKQKQDN